MNLSMFALAGSVLLSSLAVAGELVKEERQIRVATAPGAAITVHTRNGGIEIVPTASSEMVVYATIQARSQDRLAAVKVSASNDSSTGNTVHVDFPPVAKDQEEGCSLRIEVPRAKNPSLHATNGAISLRGTSGSAKIETTNGAVTIQEHDGDVTVQSSNGPITATNCRGSASLTTTNAPVTVRGAAQAFTIATDNAPVDVGLAAGFAGSVKVSTTNGMIAYPPSAKVEGKPSNSGTGGSSTQLSFGSGGSDSSIRTSNAPVTIKSDR